MQRRRRAPSSRGRCRRPARRRRRARRRTALPASLARCRPCPLRSPARRAPVRATRRRLRRRPASKPPCSALRGRFMMPAVDARVSSTVARRRRTDRRAATSCPSRARSARRPAKLCVGVGCWPESALPLWKNPLVSSFDPAGGRLRRAPAEFLRDRARFALHDRNQFFHAFERHVRESCSPPTAPPPPRPTHRAPAPRRSGSTLRFLRGRRCSRLPRSASCAA